MKSPSIAVSFIVLTGVFLIGNEGPAAQVQPSRNGPDGRDRPPLAEGTPASTQDGSIPMVASSAASTHRVGAQTARASNRPTTPVARRTSDGPTRQQRQTRLTGVLEAFIDESTPGRSNMLYYLRSDGGVRQLQFRSTPPPRPGTRMSITGFTVGDRFYVDGYDVVSRAAFSDADPVLGEQPTVVILLNFLDDPREPYTPAEVGDQVFNSSNPDSVNGKLLELSYGKAWLAGDVTDWITLPINESDCKNYLRPYSSIFQNTVDFVDPMVDFSLYRRVLVVTLACGGIASYGDMWIDTDEGRVQVSVALASPGPDMPRTMTHELGHCFVLTHPGGLECGDIVIGDFLDGCDYVIRGDRYDLMARSYQGHFSAGAKDRLGWFDPQNIVELGTGTHEITLYPLELPTDQVQMIKVPVWYDLYADYETAFYVVEYRRPIGLDEMFPELQDPAVGVVLRLIEEDYYWGSQFLDMSPHKTSEEYSQRDDSDESYLLLGVPFVDSRHDITFTLDSVTEEAAIVIIDIPRICDNGTCDPGEGPCDCPADCGEPVAVDCTGNGVADECEPDCNANGIADSCGIADGVSNDCPGGTGNGIPDECEVFADCNGNGVTDACDIDGGVSIDLNANGIPDECEPHITVYVDLANCPGPGTGTASDPFCRIQDALDDQAPDAGQNGVVEIIVADGTYTGEGNTDLRFGGRSCALRSANGPQNCIIDMQGVGRGVTFDGEESAGARLEGFTITGGTGAEYEIQGLGVGYTVGGGIFCDAWTSPTIVNCTVTGNSAEFLGGGIHADKWARPTIADCRITYNYLTHDTVEKHGAGISCHGASPLIRDCLITDNQVLGISGLRKGGGIGLWKSARPTIERCVIARNIAVHHGGGISCVYGSHPVILDTVIEDNTLLDHIFSQGGGLAVTSGGATLRGCRITGNTMGGAADTEGGGVYLHESEVTMQGCTIAGNTTHGKGGGIQVVLGITELRSCLIAGNSSEQGGGGIASSFYPLGTPGTLLLESCTITGNAGGWAGGGIFVTMGHAVVDNCIVRDNISVVGSALALGDSTGTGTSMEVRYSNFDGGWPDAYVWGSPELLWGQGNVDLDPRFLDPDGPDDDAATWQDNDYHLMHHSPSVDAGNPYLWPPMSAKDVDGEPRVMGCRVDMGADELWAGCGDSRVGRSDRPARATFDDCNFNCVPDECDLGQNDCNANARPDDCEPYRDCNANGARDICDISAGTSEDYDGNGIPDECDSAEDCNHNGVMDVFDITVGTSDDDNVNGIPDECEDCQQNGVLDDWDINGSDPDGDGYISSDCNDNDIPDECDIANCQGESWCADVSPVDGVIDDCESPSLALTPHNVRKNRYISIEPMVNDNSSDERKTALRVMLASMKRCDGDRSRACKIDSDCPDVCDNDDKMQCTDSSACDGGACVPTLPCVEHPDVGSLLGWVGEPFQIPSGCDPPACSDQDWIARIMPDPVYRNWTETTVHIADCAIVPVVTYGLSATYDEVIFSGTLEVGTILKPGIQYYGDVVGIGTGDLPPLLGFTPPNGVVNVSDIQAVLLTIQGPLSPSAHTTWVDLHGLGDGVPPNYLLNVSDLQRVLWGIAGQEYLDAPEHMVPADCP